jgi:aspartokinase-like uncharacterized kinase
MLIINNNNKIRNKNKDLTKINNKNNKKIMFNIKIDNEMPKLAHQTKINMIIFKIKYYSNVFSNFSKQ